MGDLGSGETRQGGAPRGQQPPVFQALLLVLLGAQGQGGTPSPKCDCASNFQKRNGLFCCKGCPAGAQLKGREGCGGQCRQIEGDGVQAGSGDTGRLWGRGGSREPEIGEEGGESGNPR